MKVLTACSKADFDVARQLFLEYIEGLGVDLTFQDVEGELEQIESIYSEPVGTLLLVKEPSGYVGCIALRRYEDDICEMKRLYAKPEARGNKLGNRLVNLLFDRAKELGYRRMRLDTLPNMKSAQHLYKELGFYEIEPYYQNPIAGTVFMEKRL